MIDRGSTALQAGLYQGNLLNPAVRREIAELNGLFLDHALHPDHGADAWFNLPPMTLARLSIAAEDVRDRIAHSPITLFEVRLPEAGSAPLDPGAPDVEVDGCAARADARRAFGVTALGVFRRLSEGVPLAPRIAFGLDAVVEARLGAMSLSESYRLAAWPGLIRPRWPDHARFWSLLAEEMGRADAAHWAYATGLCLLARCERAPHGDSATRRAPRPAAHRRPATARRDVPC